MMTGRWFLVAALAFAAGACAVPEPGTRTTQADRYGELELHRNLTVPARRGWVYIQSGRVYDSAGFISLQAVDQYYTYCRLELRRAVDRVTTLEPDSFEIVGIRHDRQLVSRRPPILAGPVSQYASAASATVASTSLLLRSERQPSVDRLRCAHWEDPWSAEPPMIAQIQATLGSLMTVQQP